MKFKKSDAKALLKAGAKAQGMTLREYLELVQDMIDKAQNSQDYAVKEKFERYFGKRTPTPEEYICTITNRIKF